MLWINFLHFYQPATADRETIEAAANQSYSRIIKALLKNPRIKFTANINGCLLEKLDEYGHQAVLVGFKKLVERGQIELTGTAAYHPILPLISSTEAEAQIKLQEKLLKKFFKISRPHGFFLPEMAYDAKTGRLLKRLGYRWIILDEISGSGALNLLNCGQTYLDAQSGLKVIFRQRALSQSYVPKAITTLTNQPNITAATATDAELYGLRYNDLSGSLEKLLSEPGLETKTISEFIKNNQPKKSINLTASSWESTAAELKQKLPFALWHNKKNPLQKKIWRLAALAIKTVADYPDDYQHLWAERHLRQGLASCTFWWASGHDFKNLFGALSWSPDEIERGVNELVRAVRSLDNPRSRREKIKAEQLVWEIKKFIWSKHWQYYWKK